MWINNGSVQNQLGQRGLPLIWRKRWIAAATTLKFECATCTTN